MLLGHPPSLAPPGQPGAGDSSQPAHGAPVLATLHVEPQEAQPLAASMRRKVNVTFSMQAPAAALPSMGLEALEHACTGALHDIKLQGDCCGRG